MCGAASMHQLTSRGGATKRERVGAGSIGGSISPCSGGSSGGCYLCGGILLANQIKFLGDGNPVRGPCEWLDLGP